MQTARILIVDDERYIAQLIRYKLERVGHEVYVASNGRQALDLVHEHKPDLVLTDYQMPILSGVELAKKLRLSADTAEIPVLMVTGRGYKLPTSILAKTNIRYVMEKPFSPSELMEHIDELIAVRRAAVDTPEADAA